MTYRDVTLAPDDIQWDDGRERFAHLQMLSFWHADNAFNQYVTINGPVNVLVEFTEFHRHIANQLIVRGIDRMDVSDWAARTIRLCKALKRRRNMLRGVVGERFGETVLVELVTKLDARFPRAEWGTSPYTRKKH